MRKVILIVLPTFVLFLSSCQQSYDRTVNFVNPTPYSTHTSEGASNDLHEFMGEWIVGTLKIVPRVALMEEEYARDNSNISKMRLTIAKNGVSFDDKVFHCRSVETLNAEEMMSRFNIPSGQASILCWGDISGKEIVYKTGKVKLLSMENEDKLKEFYLVITNDNSLMLWVGEAYEYIGFYELSRIKN